MIKTQNYNPNPYPNEPIRGGFEKSYIPKLYPYPPSPPLFFAPSQPNSSKVPKDYNEHCKNVGVGCFLLGLASIYAIVEVTLVNKHKDDTPTILCAGIAMSLGIIGAAYLLHKSNYETERCAPKLTAVLGVASTIAHTIALITMLAKGYY